MILIDAALVIIVLAGLATFFVTFAARRAADANANPADAHELARAARLLERIAAADDTMPQLPASLRTEVDAFVARYYKELEP